MVVPFDIELEAGGVEVALFVRERGGGATADCVTGGVVNGVGDEPIRGGEI